MVSEKFDGTSMIIGLSDIEGRVCSIVPVTYLVESDGEENEATLGLDKERLILFGKGNVTNKFAVNIFSVRHIVRGGGGGLVSPGSVDLLALGEESGLREVIISLGEVDLASALLGRGGVDVDAGEASGDLFGRSLEVVLSYGRHGCRCACRCDGWCVDVNDDGCNRVGAEGMRKDATVGVETRTKRNR